MSAPPSNRPDSNPNAFDSNAPESSDGLDCIVRQALELPADDRMAFVQLRCSGDNLLLAQALEKLKSNSPRWWDLSIESRDFERAGGLHQRTGEMIGSYRVIRSLGAGGMGEVLLAERDDRQFRQQVAIKLVKRGTLSPTVQARLKVERQILATLDHPNIARLLDGGTDTDSTPYIVMEYIEGEPIDAYCDRNKLGIDARIALFRTVCSAVHCAHQNLIVHRDLKPSNILVTADGIPKLLDFGIAKIIDDRPLLHTMAVTQMDVRVMTPEHASPEQVRGDLITTVSDVYCLGVLLFELLSGARPYAIASHRLSEIERAICDEDPQPLSASLADRTVVDVEQLCANRSTVPAKLQRTLSGDLSNIVMTALRKEPERRYASAEQFSADLGRYLAGMPVTASKDSWQYRAQKFVQRHRWGVGIGSLALASVIAFAVVTTLQARLILREQARATQVSSFLIDMFEQADPTHSRGRDITVREMLDIGSRRIVAQLKEQPDTQAHLQATVGRVYANLGLYDEAEPLLRDSIAVRTQLYGAQNPETAASKQYLGDALLNKKDYSNAAPLLEEALAINRRAFGNRGIKLAASLRSAGELRQEQQNLAAAEQLFRESLQVLAATSPTNLADKLALDAETSATLNRIAILLEKKGAFADAEAMYRRALSLSENTLGQDHPTVAFLTHNLAIAIERQGRLTEAQPLFSASLELYRKVFGPEHSETLAAMTNYAAFLHRVRQLDAAEENYRAALTLSQKVLGERHSLVGYNRMSLGILLHDKHRHREAESELRGALDIYEGSLPTNHTYKGAARRSLALTLIELGRHREAEQELTRAIKIFRASLSENNPQIVTTNGALGKALAAQKRYSEAEPLLLDNFRMLLEARGADNPGVLRMHEWIEELYRDWGKPEQAQRFFASVPNATNPTR